MQISTCSLPPSYEEAVGGIDSARGMPCGAFATLRSQLVNLRSVRNCLLGYQASVPLPVRSAPMEGSLQAKLISVCSLPRNLDVSVRYQFGSYPCSYDALLTVAKAFKANVEDSHAALAAVSEQRPIEQRDASLLPKLLAACSSLDKQYQVWEDLIRLSKDPMLANRRKQWGEAIANPFIGIRHELAQLHGELHALTGLPDDPPPYVPYASHSHRTSANPTIVTTTDDMNGNI